MIRRVHQADGLRSEALYSDCETYRYRLQRDWGPDRRRAVFVMLNPSTADEVRNDPTVARCETRARRLGFDGYVVVNLFAYRATRPADLFLAADPIGPDNDQYLRDAATHGAQVICAWGVHGAHSGRDQTVLRLLAVQGQALWHLGLTRHGHPRHPLYQPGAAPLQRWTFEENH